MSLQRTALHPLHVEAGARMTDFAGYEMPLRYPSGTIAEHLHTRAEASLFDVSHMGVIELHGPDRAPALERLVPSDIAGLAPGRGRYTFLTNDAGGIRDDLIVHNAGERLVAVANATRKHADVAHLESMLGSGTSVKLRDDLCILALQGPEAAVFMSSIVAEAGKLAFMQNVSERVRGGPALISRSGYTGEDGFELILPADTAVAAAEVFLANGARWAGLGARDTLRLEAGLCLYGQDLDESTTPVEAGLGWTIQRSRRLSGGFPGSQTILRQLDRGTQRTRVGLRPEGRAPVREGAILFDDEGFEAGRVTSGGFGPSLGRPVAMGYVSYSAAPPGTRLTAQARGKEIRCRVTELPFVPHRYRRGETR